MALTLRKPTRPAVPAGRPYASGRGSAPSVRPAYASGGKVSYPKLTDPNSPYMGGEVGPMPYNPKGKPRWKLNEISREVRSGQRAPSRPADRSSDDSSTSQSLKDALALAHAAPGRRAHYAYGGMPGAPIIAPPPLPGRPHFASGGTAVDEGSASWLNPTGNAQAQQMLASGMPASAVYAQTGWRPINGQLQYDPQVQPQAATPQYADGGATDMPKVGPDGFFDEPDNPINDTDAGIKGRHGLAPGDPMGAGGLGPLSQMGQTNTGSDQSPYLGAQSRPAKVGVGRNAVGNMPLANGTIIVVPGQLGKPGRFHDGTDSTDYTSLQTADPQGSYADGGSIAPHLAHALRLAHEGHRLHFDNGGMPMMPAAYAMRPHFDNGGGDGNGGGDSGGGDSGGEGGGGVGGMGGSEGGYGEGGVGGTVGGMGSSDATGLGSVGSMAGSVGAGPAVGGFSGSATMGGTADTAGLSSNPAAGFGTSTAPMGNIGGSMDAFGNVSGMQSTGFTSGPMSGMSTAPSIGAVSSAPSTGFSAASQEAGLGNVGSIAGSVSAPATTSSFSGANGTNNTVGGSLNAGVSADASGAFSGFGANGLAAGTNLGNMSNTGDNTFGANGLAGTGYSAFGSFSPGNNAAAMGNNAAPANAGYAGDMGVGSVGAFGAFGSNVGSLAGNTNVSGMQAGFSTPMGVAGSESQFGNAVSPGYGFSSTNGLNAAPSSASLGVDPGSMASLGVNPNATNTEDAPAAIDGLHTLTVHADPPAFAPGNVTGDAPTGALADDQTVTYASTAADYAAAAKAMGMNLSNNALAGLVGRNMTEAGTNLAAPGSPAIAGIDTGSLNVGDAANGTNSVGINQMNNLRAQQFNNVMQAAPNMDPATAATIAGAATAKGTAATDAVRAALRAAPASLPTQIAATLGEINSSPQFAGIKSVLTNPNSTLSQVNAAMQAYEGSKNAPADMAKTLGYAQSVLGAIQAYNGASSSVTGPAQVAGATPAPAGATTAPAAPTDWASQPVPTAVGPDGPAAPAVGLPGSPTTTTAPPTPNDWANQPVPTAVGPDGPAAPATGLPSAPSLPADDTSSPSSFSLSGLLSGITGTAPSMISIGSTLGGVLGGISPGSPGGVTGSGNGNSGANGPAYVNIPSPPSATAATSAAAGSATPPTIGPTMQGYLQSLLGGIQPTATNAGGGSGSGGGQSSYTPPPIPRSPLYNPMQDPIVLRALGYAV